MDNVHYSELADFFHCWLRELAPFSGYPAQATTTRNDSEVQSPSPTEFEATIGQVWQECARVLRPGGILAFTFHQARISGWIALMRALANSGFTVTAVQPVQGEMITSVTKGGTEPSNLDAVVICRKMQEPRDQSTDPVQAAEAAVRRLVTLLDAGITAGAGDIRSVVRGQVLAIYTETPSEHDLAQLANLADELASEYVRRLSAREK
jgi:putative DNA methylase